LSSVFALELFLVLSLGRYLRFCLIQAILQILNQSFILGAIDDEYSLATEKRYDLTR
jgi:hypothetical protein